MKPLGALRVTAILLIAGLSLLLATCGEWNAPRLQWPSLHPPAEQPAPGGDGSRNGLPSVLELDELVGTASKGVRQGGQVVSFGADYDPGISDSTSGREEAIEVEDTSLNLRAYEVGDYTYAIIPQLTGDGSYGGGRDDDIPLLSLFSTEVCDYGGGRDDDIPLLYYLGVADYTLGSWRWWGPFTTTNPEITLNSDDLEDRFKSPTDMLYLAVLTTAAGKETSQLPREGLVAALPFEPSPRTVSQLEDPVGVRVNVVTTDVDSGIGTLPQIVTGLEAVVGASSITLTWDDNPDPHVTMHQVFRENLTLGSAMEWLADVPMPALEYEDTTAVTDTTYRYFVQAVNDVGAGGSASVEAEITGLWRIVVVDSAGDVGEYTSLAIVNGNPAISYCDGTNLRLKFVRASDASGFSWGSPISMDSTYEGYTSLAVVNGNPAISYNDEINDDLKYVRASDANGALWNLPLAVDSAGYVGEYTSLAVVSGNPAISYYDDTNYDLKYVRASDASGSSWGTPITVDSAGRYEYTSLAIVNGNPAISYRDATNLDLKYVRASDTSGSSWGAPVIVDSTGSVGYYTSLAVVNGNPAISYCDNSNSDLKYARATDANGSSWGTLRVDSIGSVGYYTSLAVVNGNPAISYLGDSQLKYVRASDANGGSWNLPLTVDSAGTVGWHTSLEVVNGNPAISYYDATNGDLKYAYYTTEP